MCKTYRQRPSQVLKIDDDSVAFDFDLAMAAIHRAEADSRVRMAVEQSTSADVGILMAVLELIS
jgi:hypothetical protein